MIKGMIRESVGCTTKGENTGLQVDLKEERAVRFKIFVKLPG
tara:strand:- start:263 stop:388 length:126 start_codon:yes stop_codon:yes gene_type:complete